MIILNQSLPWPWLGQVLREIAGCEELAVTWLKCQTAGGRLSTAVIKGMKEISRRGNLNVTAYEKVFSFEFHVRGHSLWDIKCYTHMFEWMSWKERGLSHNGPFSLQEAHTSLDVNIKDASKPSPLGSYSAQMCRRPDSPSGNWFLMRLEDFKQGTDAALLPQTRRVMH